MTNKEYWQRRSLLDKAGSTNIGEDFLKEKIEPVYKQALHEIETDIEIMYDTFASKEKISLAEAKRMIKQADFKQVDFSTLAKTQVQDRKDLIGKKETMPGDIVAAIEKQHMEHESLLASYTKKGQISHLELLHTKIEKALINLYDENQMHLYDFLSGQYEDGYYKAVFNGQQFLGFGKDFATLNERAIERAILNAYQRKNFSDTLWKHRKNLSDDLRTNLAVGLTRGESLEKMASRIAKRMEVSKSNARRLVRTETAYIYEQATRKGYEECEIEKYEFLATLDMRTSKICRSFDGKIFKLKDAVPGKNYPPMHPNCRSTTVAAFDDDVITNRLAKDKEGKYHKVPSNMSYKKWRKKYVPVAGKTKTAIIKLTDAQQYAINDYVSFGSYELNRKLRTGQTLEAAERKMVKALDSALDKCPSYEGNLSRSLYFDYEEDKEAFLKQHEVGETVTYNFFTSTTKGEVYNPDGQIQIYIQNARNGKDISNINKSEKEVLFKRGQKFKVINSKEMDGVTYILMEEI